MQQKSDRKLYRKLYGPIQLPKCFSCFLGFYDLRLYTGNVMMHHILLFIDVCKGFVYNYESFSRGPGSWPSIDYAFA